MDIIKLTGKIILGLILVVGLLLVVKYADTIRSVIAVNTRQSVAGAKTSLENEIKENVEDYANNAKESVMNIRASDILSGISKFGKIGRDIKGTKEEIVKGVSGILNR